MRHRIKSYLSAICCLAIVISTIGASLAPLLDPTASLAQTSPQDTDLFTGQFIPAYLGSAYDPTEAYKQMAGLPVYVFAYDTFGKIVNNFAYKTQIKADGSFQAAGMPNASHYGVCFGVNDGAQDAVFRAPLPEDNLQQVFAYNQAEYAPTDPKATPFPNPNTQVVKSYDDTGKPTAFEPANLNNDASSGHTPFYLDKTVTPNVAHGCRIFLTSNRTVDIANHLNIFPLVPNTVLSVIIKDPTTTRDYSSLNKPYEIYAQRVIVNSSTSIDDAISQPCDATDISCNNQESLKNTITNGPIIRGRSVPYDNDPTRGNPQATIFQAFAPKGLYVITYWRPSETDPASQITYLNYDGSQPLNTSSNGLAIEEVSFAGQKYVIPGQTKTTQNQWYYLSSRDPMGKDPSCSQGSASNTCANNAWQAQEGSANAWGIVTANSGGRLVPQANAPISTDTSSLYYIDFTKRPAANDATGKTNKGTTGKYGIYFFSSLCDPGVHFTNTTATISVQPYSTPATQIGGAVAGAAQSAANGTLLKVAGQTNISISLNGDAGAGRQDLSFAVDPNGLTGMLKKDSSLAANVWVNLKANGRYFSHVAKSDQNGQFVIPYAYLGSPSSASNYLLSFDVPNNSSNRYNTSYRLDASALPHGSVLAANYTLGTIDLNRKVSKPEQFLAQLNLPALLTRMKIPTVYAAGYSGSFDENNVRIYFDTSTIQTTYGDILNPANYTLAKAEIDNPDNSDLPTQNVDNQSNYQIFTTVYPTEQSYITAGAPYNSDPRQAPDHDNGEIAGVVLRAKTDQEAIWTYKKIFLNNPTETSIKFWLNVRFERKNCDVSTTDDTNNKQDCNSYNKNNDQTPPPVGFSARVPIILTYNGPDYNANGSYSMSYDNVVLEAIQPSCAKGGNLFWIVPSFTKQITSMVCSVANGIIGVVKWGLGIVADNFFVADPLSFLGTGGMVKSMWNGVRNLVNGVMVLILVLAGVAIMFRYEPKTYSIQSVLTNLLITIVAVNFSILILQFAIDIANVLASGGYYFLIGTLGSFGGGNLHGALGAAAGMGALAGYLVVLAISTGGAGLVGFIIGILLILLALAYFIMRLIMQWAIRMIVLTICVVFAPAAIAARLLPGTKSYFDKWRSLFIGTLMAQVVFALVLGIGIGFLQASINQSGLFQGLIIFALAMFMFYYASKAPEKVAGAFGAGFTAGMMSKAVGMIPTTKGLLDKVGATERAKRNAEREFEDALRKNTGQNAVSTVGKWGRSFRLYTGKNLPGMGDEKERALLHAKEEGRKAGLERGAQNFEIEGEGLDQFRGTAEAEVRKEYLDRLVKHKYGTGTKFEHLRADQQDEINRRADRWMKINQQYVTGRARHIQEEANHNRHNAFEGAQVFNAGLALMKEATGVINPSPDVAVFDKLLQSTNRTKELKGITAADLDLIINGTDADSIKLMKDYGDVIRFARSKGGVANIGQLQNLLTNPANAPELDAIGKKMGYSSFDIREKNHLGSFSQVLAKRAAKRTNEIRFMPGPNHDDSLVSVNDYLNFNRKQGKRSDQAREADIESGVRAIRAIDRSAVGRVTALLGTRRMLTTPPTGGLRNGHDLEDVNEWVDEINQYHEYMQTRDLTTDERDDYNNAYTQLEDAGFH